MKKLIYKTSLFVAPFMLIYCMNLFLCKQHEGDMVRVGYLYSNPTLTARFGTLEKEYQLEKKYTQFSELYPGLKGKYDVLTIGDSFANLGNAGYQNYLAHKDVSVLNFDFLLLGLDPVEALNKLINGDFFDSINVDYVVLECVERYIVDRCSAVDPADMETIDSLGDKLEDGIVWNQSANPVDFFSHNTLYTPIQNIGYLFSELPMKAVIYKPKTSKSLFTVKSKRLLFYKEDYLKVPQKNDIDSVRIVTDTLNLFAEKLAERNISLLVMIAPDKYDMYYPYIVNKEMYEAPRFYSLYSQFSKNYIDIPAYAVLSEKIGQGIRDMYYYDDTHWSQKSSPYVADTIYELLKGAGLNTK